MRGHIKRQSNLFVKINLEELVPAEHPLRPIKALADEALAGMSRTFAAAYAPASKGGRPSVPPERMVKALVLLTLYTIRSERAMCERITFDMLFRWFLDMTPDGDCFDHSDFTNFRTRIKDLDVTKKFSDAIVKRAFDAGLISEEHFSVDGSLLRSLASLKSLRPIGEIKRAAQEQEDQKKAGKTPQKGKGDKSKGDSGDDAGAAPGGAGGRPDSNAWVDFKGQKRSNKTHRSTTDPEARLYKKGEGQAALPHHLMHVLMENRHGIGVDIRVGVADGHGERKCALRMLDRVKRALGLEPTTLGADKGYDAADFLLALEERGIEPHVSCKSKAEIDVPDEDDDGAWARWHNQQSQSAEAFKISQRKRKRNEEIFGWGKVVGGLRKMRVARRWKIQQLADIALATLNMVRLSKLLAT
jgi:transposase